MNIVDMLTVRFNRWRPTMEKIIREQGDYTSVDDIYNRCMELKLLYFDTPGAFAVIDVIEETKVTRLHIQLAGGSLEALFKLEQIVAKFGVSIGATKMTFVGRKGFTRALSKFGWCAPVVYMEKEIPNG